MAGLMTLDPLNNGYFNNCYGNALQAYSNTASMYNLLANANNSLFSGAYDPMQNGYLGNMNMGFNPMMMNPMMSMGGFGFGMNNYDYQKLQALPIEQRQEYINNIQLRNQEIQLEQNDKLNDLNFDRNIRQQQYQNSYTAPQTAIKQAAQKLKFMVMDNRKDEIIPAFDALVNLIAEQPQNKIRRKEGNKTVEERMNPESLRAKALEAYQQVNGSDFLQDVDAELSGSFTQGLKQGLLPSLTDKTDSSDITAHAMGLKKGSGDKVANVVGSIAGGAAIGAAVGSVVPVIGTGVGAAVGAVVSGVRSLFKNLF